MAAGRDRHQPFVSGTELEQGLDVDVELSPEPLGLRVESSPQRRCRVVRPTGIGHVHELQRRSEPRRYCRGDASSRAGVRGEIGSTYDRHGLTFLAASAVPIGSLCSNR